MSFEREVWVIERTNGKFDVDINDLIVKNWRTQYKNIVRVFKAVITEIPSDKLPETKQD